METLYPVTDIPEFSKKKKHSAVKERLRFELYRLLTFICWNTGKTGVFPTLLAKAGFFFTGLGDTVECFACNIRVSDWHENKDPEAEHASMSPGCLYKTLNIPVSDTSSLDQPESSSLTYSNDLFSTEKNLHTKTFCVRYSEDPCFSDLKDPNTTDKSVKSIKDTMLYNQQKDGANNNNDLQIDGLQSLPVVGNVLPRNINRYSRTHSQNECRSMRTEDMTDMLPITIADPRGQGFHPRHDILRDERYRIQTFRNWPSNAPVTPAELARTGFFHVGPEDRVQCVFCRGILRNWAPGDSASEEHQRHFPSCKFLLGGNVGNVPLPIPGVSGYSASPALFRNQERYDKKVDITSNVEDMYEETGIIHDQPKHPEYAIKTKRLTTYTDWPKHLPQTPEILADCGFYSLGIDDSVKCFFCDGGLRSWDPKDDPWEEHARWFYKCGYLRQQKGMAFIKAVNKKYPRYPAPAPGMEPVEPMETSSPESDTLPSVSGSQDCLDDPKIQEQVHRQEFKEVISMFDEQTVKNAIMQQFKNNGAIFNTANELVEAILKETAKDDNSSSSEEAQSAASREKVVAHTMEVQKPSSDDEATGQQQAAAKSSPPPPSKKDKKKRKKTDDGGSDTKVLEEQIRVLKEERVCKVCLDELISIVFLPCGHMVCCATCAPALRVCPICRESIKGNVKAYIS